MNLDYHAYDADNHLYEPIDAFTRHLPERYSHRHSLRGHRRPHQDRHQQQDQRVHPEPHLRGGRRTRRLGGIPPGQSTPRAKTLRQLTGKPIRCLPAFRHPDDRVKLLDEQGVYGTLLFPTLASLLEERMKGRH